MLFKNIFYDWFGLSKTLQQCLHTLTENETYNQIMLISSNYLGNYKLFPAHLALIAIMLSLVVHNLNKQLSRSSLIKYHSDIIRSAYVLSTSLIVGVILTEISKRFFALPRPFCADHMLSQIALSENCFRAFPSGHSAYITIMIGSFWPLLNKPFKIIAVIMALLVYISRISLDYHYPSDVIYSALISLGILLFVNKHVDKISNKFSSINYHTIRLLTKI
jgi:membrane-associated phospholipid phosphatase